jgi:hypothetical protein
MGIFGGFAANGSALNDLAVLAIDPVNSSDPMTWQYRWHSILYQGTPRAYCSLLFHDGKFFVYALSNISLIIFSFGGTRNNVTALSERFFWRYDVLTQLWTDWYPQAFAVIEGYCRFQHTTVHSGDYVYMIGGYDINGNFSKTRAYLLFSKGTRYVAPVDEMTQSSMSRAGAAVAFNMTGLYWFFGIFLLVLVSDI